SAARHAPARNGRLLFRACPAQDTQECPVTPRFARQVVPDWQKRVTYPRNGPEPGDFTSPARSVSVSRSDFRAYPESLRITECFRRIRRSALRDAETLRLRSWWLICDGPGGVLDAGCVRGP